MVKIFHEAPISIFKDVQAYTDGDYALVHLFEENEEYYKLFEQAVADGREVILDNSIFELGTAFDGDRYVHWIEKLKPTWYIVPDVLEDADATLTSFYKFKADYAGKLPGKVIAVAQGRSVFDMLRCFDELHEDPYVDMVALSFDLKFYEDINRRLVIKKGMTFNSQLNPKLVDWIIGRSYIIDLLRVSYEVGYYHKPVHLLGCALPFEGIAYNTNKYNFIYSTDTSNPVVSGFERVRYTPPFGLFDKSHTKLFQIINEQVDNNQLKDIIFNIKAFKSFWEQKSTHN